MSDFQRAVNGWKQATSILVDTHRAFEWVLRTIDLLATTAAPAYIPLRHVRTQDMSPFAPNSSGTYPGRRKIFTCFERLLHASGGSSVPPPVLSALELQ